MTSNQSNQILYHRARTALRCCSAVFAPCRALGLAVLLCAVNAYAGEPPAEPILRINTPMHTAMINAAAINADETLLLTASDDKTAKLWDLNSGQLQRTLRVPIGDDADEGKLYVAAFDPQGRWVALAGWTGSWDGTASIYLLNPDNGQILHRLGGLPNVIYNLCVAPDGSRLAATLGGANGVRQWRSDNWQQIASDSNYADDSYGCAYTRDLRLLTGSLDGHLRLYAADGSLDAKIATAAHGSRPFKVAIHPDNQHFAVGYNDNTTVSLGSLAPLRIDSTADTGAIDNGNLSKVAWSADGRSLYAGGRYYDGTNGICPVLRWDNAGRGTRTTLSGANTTVYSILPLRSDELLSAAGDPAWLRQSNNGQVSLRQDAATFDMRDKDGSAWQISADARRLYLGREQRAKNPVVIDLKQRSVMSVSVAPDGLYPANSERLAVNGWKNTTSPTLDGQPLSLKPYETSRSVAIASDAQGFVLGTEWYLRRFAADGSKVWQKSVPSLAWGVNLTPDDRLVVATLADGTIRWYRYADGEELLAMFVDKNSLEWVAWTPQGYYDASANGDQLIGWHVNRGKEQAPDFFPASKFRERFYRPQVVQNILDTLDIDAAIKLANQQGERTNPQQSIADALPPALDILNLDNNAALRNPRLSLELDIRSDSSDLKYLRVLSNGETIAEQPLNGRSGRYQISVDLPPRDQLLSVFAVNGNGSAVPVSRFIQWQGAKPADVLKPTLYVLAIGVSDYDDDSLDLNYPAKDANDFAAAMAEQKGLYRDVKVKLLTNPDDRTILDGLDWLKANVTDRDVAMLFYAGHGSKDEYGKYQLLARNSDPDNLRRSAVPAEEVKTVLAHLPGKRIAFLDACYSGDIWGDNTRGLGSMINMDDVANELAAVENGIIVFSSSTGKQLSQENAAWQNGAFTKALIEGLGGKADYKGERKITYTFLNAYITDRVKELTGNAQTPTLVVPESIPDFPIAVVQ